MEIPVRGEEGKVSMLGSGRAHGQAGVGASPPQPLESRAKGCRAWPQSQRVPACANNPQGCCCLGNLLLQQAYLLQAVAAECTRLGEDGSLSSCRTLPSFPSSCLAHHCANLPPPSQPGMPAWHKVCAISQATGPHHTPET